MGSDAFPTPKDHRYSTLAGFEADGLIFPHYIATVDEDQCTGCEDTTAQLFHFVLTPPTDRRADQQKRAPWKATLLYAKFEPLFRFGNSCGHNILFLKKKKSRTTIDTIMSTTDWLLMKDQIKSLKTKYGLKRPRSAKP